jgi:hypothetical protein
MTTATKPHPPLATTSPFEPVYDSPVTPDEVLEKQCAEYGIVPSGFTPEHHPSHVDEEFAAVAAIVETEVREPLPIGVHDEAQDQLYRIVRSHARLDDQENRLDEFYKATKAWIASRRTALAYVTDQAARNLATHLISGQGGKRRSIDTPYGRVGFRRQPERLKVANSDELIAAALADRVPVNCVEEKRSYKIVMSEVQKLFKESGEIPVGCVLEPESDAFFIR